MAKIKAIIYDVDGTLLDTKEWVLSAFESVLTKNKLPVLAREQMRHLMGQSLESCYQTFAPRQPFEKLVQDHLTIQRKQMDKIKEYPHDKELLEAFKDKKQAIVSSRKGSLDVSLKNAGIYHYFDVIIGANDVSKYKPHPQGILLALERLGVSNDETIYVGDGIVDMKAARAAKLMSAIGITHGFGAKDRLFVAGADYLVNDLGELKTLIKSID